MRHIFSFIYPYRKAAIIAALLMLFELAVELWLPILMADIIDNGIIERNISIITSVGLFMLLLTVLSFVTSIINTYIASFVSQQFAFDLREALFEKIQSFSFMDFNRFPTSSLITRLTNDVNQVQLVIFMGLRIMVRAPLLVIGGVVMALFVDFQIALLLTVAIPIVIVFLFFVMKKGIALFALVQEKLDRVNGVMRENLVGIRLIKALRRSEYEQDRFKVVNDDLFERNVASLRLIELATPVLLIIMNVAIVAVIWFGGIRIIGGGTQVGDVAAIITYGTRITVALSMFSFILMILSRARASVHRMEEVFATETVTQSSSHPLPLPLRTLAYEDISFSYPEKKVLKNISFTLERGQFIGILGSTGTGKTSLIQLIPRLYEPDSGEVKWNGVNVNEVPVDELRRAIGVVPQEVMLFSDTIGENIRWGKEDASMDEIVAAAKTAQIHEFIMTLPNQYETELGQKGVNLSGGQKQRLSIARALIRKPEILILDDSTSALDLKTEAKLQQSLKDSDFQGLILLIAQKISSVKEADQIFVLEDGKVIGKGSHVTLLRENEAYQDIYASQYGEGVDHAEKTS
ncbi:ABC transporter ATP-binding protein [Guptibacillus algicola]|uniref:ABC transporter ATP-binding protein n=1 Tax=Guptibacillus algicola TaxID=225844 RepID=UPI001CD755A6|nr:ABC transporter ATP-binding protein [Alkalihalobacillus algicola]MCA0986895.1 ABC transporter ATP-binding protein/permease [Alkalihalobacillus algicola]